MVNENLYDFASVNVISRHCVQGVGDNVIRKTPWAKWKHLCIRKGLYEKLF